ncbi:hypothetical protein B0H13DRAFT_2323966 [Mycena leptocephala]|nr:hypothetical protein B0H13DRAFT_2323966 [Mycena leptocephala]
MHPSLALRNLHRLPLAIRRRALAAADSGSPEELGALNMSSANLVHLLPVYYAGLDDSVIPSLLAQLDLSEAEFDSQPLIRKLSHVVRCLQGLLLLDNNDHIPGPPSPDLWTRAWPWIEFLNTHRDNLPRLPVPEINPLSVIIALGKDKETGKLMRMTPGFRILVFRVWAQSLDQAHLVPNPGAFEMFCVYMTNAPLTITEEHEFEEAIEGAGGSQLSLARLCVDHIKCVVQSVVVSAGTWSLRGVIALLQRRCEVDSSFQKILIDQGIVTTLIYVACRLSSPSFSADDNIFNVSFAIQYYFRIHYGHNLVTEALRAGLLRALLAWGRMSPPKPQSLEQLNLILTTLSRSLVYLSVLLQLRASIDELEILIDGHTFQGFPISEKWEAFWSILQPRWP